MAHRAFVIADDHATLVANNNTDFRYLAAEHELPVGAQMPVRRCDRAETHFMIEDGIVEFMIGGAAGMVLPGDFVRVPAGVNHAYRNAGDEPAHILVRTVSPSPVKRSTSIVVHFAA